MPIFRVTASKLEVPKDFNPFRMRLSESSMRLNTKIRTWEFEADDKAHVERLFTEAQEAMVANVYGFRLGAIEEIRTEER